MDDFGAGPSTSDDNGDNLPSGEKCMHTNREKNNLNIL
jgi:hypothetical protein